MDFALDSKSKKFETNQKKSRDIAKQKLEKQKEVVKKVSLASEELKKYRESKAESQINKPSQNLQSNLPEHNSSLLFGLQPYVLDDDKSDDHVVFPSSIAPRLLYEDGINGILTFKITAVLKDGSRKSSMCGVRDYSAPDQSLGLTPKVLKSLHCDLIDIASIEIDRIELPKCTYAKLRPVSNDFHRIDAIKYCLEENLRMHATLSVGDQLSVWYRGKEYIVNVLELKPNQAVCLHNSDVNLDIDNSDEFYADQQKRIEDKESSTKNSVGRKLVENVVSDSSSSVVSPGLASGINSSNDIPVEPSVGEPNVVTLKIRTPNNITLSRRFYSSDQMKVVFNYISKSLNMDVDRMNLVHYPSLVLNYKDWKDMSLFQSGVKTSNEMLTLTVE